MNDEISTKDPTNKYSIPKASATLNPSPAEGKYDGAMKQQLNDTLILDPPVLARENRPQSNDPTGNTPMGPSEVGTQKPIFNGTLHEAMIGGKKGTTQDFRRG